MSSASMGGGGGGGESPCIINADFGEKRCHCTARTVCPDGIQGGHTRRSFDATSRAGIFDEQSQPGMSRARPGGHRGPLVLPKFPSTPESMNQ